MTVTEDSGSLAGIRRVPLGVRELLNQTCAMTMRAPVIWTAIIGSVLLQIMLVVLVVPMAIFLPGSGGARTAPRPSSW